MVNLPIEPRGGSCGPPEDDALTPPVVFGRYHSAVAMWLFATAWMAWAVPATFLGGASAGFFWVGVFITAWALAVPFVRVEISPESVRVRERWLLRRRDRRFAAKDVSVSEVIVRPGDAETS